MCLAVPMQIIEIGEDGGGVAELEGSRTAVDLSLIENPARGDYVIVHAGFAIEKLDLGEADERIHLFEELGRSHAEDDPAADRS
jgi:hydrogenase expression/formation protein HypC